MVQAMGDGDADETGVGDSLGSDRSTAIAREGVVMGCCGRSGVNEASLSADRDAPGLRVSNGRGVRHHSRRGHRHSRLGPHAAWPR